MSHEGPPKLVMSSASYLRLGKCKMSVNECILVDYLS